jgi:hypothetical protein
MKLLGWGVFAIVKLMKNSQGQLFAVKIFTHRLHIQDDILSKSFAREFEALFNLTRPCVVPFPDSRATASGQL